MTLESKLLLNPLPQLKHKLSCPVPNKWQDNFNHTCDVGPQQVYLAPSFRVCQTMAVVMKQCLMRRLEQLAHALNWA